MSSRFDSDECQSYHYHENPEDKCKKVYYEAFDRLIACIRERFEHKDCQVYAKMQESCFLPFLKHETKKYYMDKALARSLSM